MKNINCDLRVSNRQPLDQKTKVTERATRVKNGAKFRCNPNSLAIYGARYLKTVKV